jgi:serine/threonine-protein kinase
MEAGNKLTVPGQMMGTPEYMAPEQGLGQAVDARVDIYALGVVLYEVFTGTVPFKGRSSQQIAMRHAMERPTAPSLHRPVPRALEGVILACLEKEPAKRPPSIDELWQRLEPALAETPDVPVGPAVPDGPGLPPTRPSQDTGVGFDSTLAPISDLSRAPSSVPLSRRGVALVAAAALVAVSGGIGIYRALHARSNTASGEDKGAGSAPRKTPPARPTVEKLGAGSEAVPSPPGLAASRGVVERVAGPDASASTQAQHVAEPPAAAPKTQEKTQENTQEKKHKPRNKDRSADGDDPGLL